MARLFYLSFKRPLDNITAPGDASGDELLMTTSVPAYQSIGAALEYFTNKAQLWHEKVVGGKFHNTPQCVFENSRQWLAKPLAERHAYTIRPIENGYKIWISDGPEQYVLVD